MLKVALFFANKWSVAEATRKRRGAVVERESIWLSSLTFAVRVQLVIKTLLRFQVMENSFSFNLKASARYPSIWKSQFNIFNNFAFIKLPEQILEANFTLGFTSKFLKTLLLFQGYNLNYKRAMRFNAVAKNPYEKIYSFAWIANGLNKKIFAEIWKWFWNGLNSHFDWKSLWSLFPCFSSVQTRIEFTFLWLPFSRHFCSNFKHYKNLVRFTMSQQFGKFAMWTSHWCEFPSPVAVAGWKPLEGFNVAFNE